MKVLLLSPKISVMGGESFLNGYTIGNGILFIAAATRDAGYEVAIELGNEENVTGLIKKHSPDIVGITCLTVSYPNAKNMINTIKKYNPNILTVIGGHHATFMTKEVFSECAVDYILRGEGEKAFPLLLKQIEAGNKYPNNIKGIAFRRNSRLFNLNSFTLLDDIDSLPRMATDLIPRGVKNFSPQISSSRGCPFRCSFCSISAFYNGKYRTRKIENIINDIETCSSAGYKSFWFADDNFTVDTERVRKICNELKDRGLDNLKWNCLGRVDSICRDPGMVDKIADAGCSNISFGIESGVQEIIDSYKKNITIKQVQEAVRIMNTSSIFHIWYLIIGSGDEYDHPKYIERSMDFIKKIRFDLLQVSILTPFPGTELYNKLTAENRLLHKNWEKYDAAHCVYQPLYLTPKQIEDYFVKAYKELNLDRGFDVVRVIIKGLRTGTINPLFLLKTSKYWIDIFVRKKDIYEVMK